MHKALTTDDAAPYCGFTRASFETYRSRGLGPRYTKIGRKVIYLIEDLDAWLQSHRDNTKVKAAA